VEGKNCFENCYLPKPVGNFIPIGIPPHVTEFNCNPFSQPLREYSLQQRQYCIEFCLRHTPTQVGLYGILLISTDCYMANAVFG
jgi:hypothetical protein